MNKKQKSGIILTSLASIALAGSLIGGATYALFTIESQTNIVVSSGSVDVEATISDFSAYTPKLIASNASSIIKSDNIATKQTDGSYTFGLGGTVSLTDGEFSIDRMTPGDKVNFTVNIKNNSNVKAKYRTVIKVTEDDGLYTGLYFSVGSEKLNFNEDKTFYFAWMDLPVGAEDTTIPLAIELPISAGNEYKNKNAKIVVSVEAIQGNVEVSDDANSLMYITNTCDNEYLANKLSENNLSDNVSKILYRNEVTEEESKHSYQVPQTTISQTSTFNLSNKEVKIDKSNYESYGNATPVVLTVSGENTTLTINDKNNSGIFNCEAEWGQVYGISIKEGNVVINGGNYYGAGTAIQITSPGKLTINGGFFDLAPTIKAFNPTQTRYNFYNYMINCLDSVYKNGLIKITGGTFVNFDPSNNPEGTGTTYVAEGYTVTSQVQANGETWYSVVAK